MSLNKLLLRPFGERERTFPRLSPYLSLLFTVAPFFGVTHTNSCRTLGVYLETDEKRLRDRALSISAFAIGKEVLA